MDNWYVTQQITAELHLCDEPRIRMELAPILGTPNWNEAPAMSRNYDEAPSR